MTRVSTWLCSRGHTATTRELATVGVTERRLAAAVKSGRLLRVSRGVYACAHLDDVEHVAASGGYLVDCVSALDRHDDLWSGRAPAGLHLRGRPGHHHPAPPPGAVVHWSKQHGVPTHSLEVAPIDALLRAMRCLEPTDALACVESALHLGYLPETDLATLLGMAPRWMAGTLARLDRGAQSGLETHTRTQIQDAGHHVATQVNVPGAGHLDLLVDDLVGIETDGRKWHAERFMLDRTKDIRTEWWGIRVLRIGAPHVFETWPETLATIEQMLRHARRR